MEKPEKLYRTRFEARDCPKCKRCIIPEKNGKTNEMHGYQIHCPECHAFIGWGGKTYFIDKAA
jgi:hypothetical protein